MCVSFRADVFGNFVYVLTGLLMQYDRWYLINIWTAWYTVYYVYLNHSHSNRLYAQLSVCEFVGVFSITAYHLFLVCIFIGCSLICESWYTLYTGLSSWGQPGDKRESLILIMSPPINLLLQASVNLIMILMENHVREWK